MDNGFYTILLLLTLVLLPKITINTSIQNINTDNPAGCLIYLLYFAGFTGGAWVFRQVVNLFIRANIIFWDWWQAALLFGFYMVMFISIFELSIVYIPFITIGFAFMLGFGIFILYELPSKWQ